MGLTGLSCGAALWHSREAGLSGCENHLERSAKFPLLYHVIYGIRIMYDALLGISSRDYMWIGKSTTRSRERSGVAGSRARKYRWRLIGGLTLLYFIASTEITSESLDIHSVELTHSSRLTIHNNHRDRTSFHRQSTTGQIRAIWRQVTRLRLGHSCWLYLQ
jgi:hypothetical protein